MCNLSIPPENIKNPFMFFDSLGGIEKLISKGYFQRFHCLLNLQNCITVKKGINPLMPGGNKKVTYT